MTNMLQVGSHQDMEQEALRRLHFNDNLVTGLLLDHSLFATTADVTTDRINLVVVGALISILCLATLAEIAQARGGDPLIQRGANQYPGQPPLYGRSVSFTHKKRAVRSVNAVRLLPAESTKTPVPPTIPSTSTASKPIVQIKPKALSPHSQKSEMR